MNPAQAFSPSRWSIQWRVGAALFLVPLLLIGLAVFQFWMSNRVAGAYQEITNRVGLVAIHLEVMMRGAQMMETGARGYVVSGDQEYLTQYQNGKSSFQNAYGQAEPLTRTNPALRQRLREFYEITQGWERNTAEPALAVITSGAATPEWSTGWARENVILFNRLQDSYDGLRGEVLRLRQAHVEDAARLRLVANVSTLAVHLLALLLALRLAQRLTRLVTRPVQEMVEHSRRVERGDYSPAPIMRNDEFGRVTGAMNSMALSIRARLEREQLIGRIRAAISRSLDWDTVLQTTVDEAGKALNASRCFICLYRDEATAAVAATATTTAVAATAERVPRVAYEWTAPGVEPLGIGHAMPESFLVLEATHPQTLIVADVATEARMAETPEHREKLLALSTRALMDTPLLLRGEIIGMIGVHECSGPRRWVSSDAELFETVASHVATALDNARLFHESVTRATELQAARDALDHSSQQLREKNRELEEFVYTVSHDLKAPIISMQGYLAALQADYGEHLEEDAHFYIRRATANSRQLQSLISDLIELSRIGRTGEPWQEVDLNELLRDVESELQVQAGARGVHIKIASDLPMLCCEQRRIRQVFVNLIDNAIKYSDPKKAERWIKLEARETPDEWIFCVADNGVGIAEHHLEKAFGIFQRVGKSKETGSGIGLSIVRRTAESHGGRAWAESGGEGQGTQFYFSVRKQVSGSKLTIPVET